MSQSVSKRRSILQIVTNPKNYNSLHKMASNSSILTPTPIESHTKPIAPYQVLNKKKYKITPSCPKKKGVRTVNILKQKPSIARKASSTLSWKISPV